VLAWRETSNGADVGRHTEGYDEGGVPTHPKHTPSHVGDAGTRSRTDDWGDAGRETRHNKGGGIVMKRKFDDGVLKMLSKRLEKNTRDFLRGEKQEGAITK